MMKMAKRRKKESDLIVSENKIDSYSDSEDYTADFESYDCSNFGNNQVDLMGETDKKFDMKLKNDSFPGNQLRTEISEGNEMYYDDEANLDNVCRDYLRFTCRRGRKCKFKHPINAKKAWQNVGPETVTASNVQYEVNFCHDFQNNGCNRPQCRFIHCTRSEQEFYYGTGILPSNIPYSTLSFCKDYLNGSCTRVKCRFSHVTQEDLEQHSRTLANKVVIDTMGSTGQPLNSAISSTTASEYMPGYSHPAPLPTGLDHVSIVQQQQVLPVSCSTGNFYPNYASSNANATQFTVSLPLGSVSYSTSQQQLIAQPTLTNVQFIHESPFTSAQEMPPVTAITLPNMPPSSLPSNLSQPQPAPQQQQQLVYSGIIHNPHRHNLHPQFAIISAENSLPLPNVVANTVSSATAVTSAHILNHSALAIGHHHHQHHQQPNLAQSQPPPMGMSLISVATPCSLISGSPSTTEVVHTIQQQQMHPFEQKDNCLLQNTMANSHNMEMKAMSESSTLTPIYIHHQSLPTSMPITQYRVTALETNTTPPGLVIHNTAVEGTNFIQPLSAERQDFIDPDNYSKLVQENETLKRKLQDLEKQTSDLQTANEMLLDQNARLRNFKNPQFNLDHSGICEKTGKSINNNADSSSSSNNIPSSAEQQSQSSQSRLINNHLISHSASFKKLSSAAATSHHQVTTECGLSPSEMATITLTVPIAKPHTTSILDSHTALIPVSSSNNTIYTTSSSTTSSSNYLSPTLVTSAIHSIQKNVMPTLQALVASGNSGNGGFTNISDIHDEKLPDKCSTAVVADTATVGELVAKVTVPIRSSSCPVSLSSSLMSPETVLSADYHDPCKLRLHNFTRHTAQLCFQ